MGKILELVTTVPKLRYRYSDIKALLPAEYKDKITPNEDKNRPIGNQLLRWCIVQSTHFLDPATANVLQFIVTRTYLYAKEAELISVSHFILGVFSGEDGRSLAAPAVKDKATVYKALATLEQIGAIDRTRVTVNSADVISLICVNAEAILSMNMTKEQAEMLRESRRQKRMESMEIDESMCEFEVKVASSRVSGFPTTRVSEKPDTEYINKKENKKELSCSVPRNVMRISRSRKPAIEIDCKKLSAKEAIDKAVARVTEKREAKVRRAAARTGFIALADFNATWQQAMVGAFGKCTVSGLTHKEYGMLKRIAKTHNLNCSWKEFLDWVVANWRRINRESKEIADYKKRKHGDWSLKEEDRIFLGTDSPDTFMLVKNFGKLVKRFSQAQLSTVAGTQAETAEIIELRKELAAAKIQAATGRKLLDKALSAKGLPSAPTPATRKPVKIVNPETDTFFEEVDATLPDWR